VIEQMATHRAPLPHYAPRSSATRCYERLFAEAIAREFTPTGSE
jgi:hypothetical protein